MRELPPEDDIIINDFINERCCCAGVDVEMKNAVAIQRNSAAIAALIKAYQKLQAELEELKQSIEESSES